MSNQSETTALSLSSPSDLRILPVIRALVKLAGELAGLNDQRAYEAVVAVNEACSNVIHHAHNGDRHANFQVSCQATKDGLEITLRDQGPPFDFSAVPELDPTEIRAGGRGVYLIRRLMDQVTAAPLPDGGNELRMVKRKVAL